jgi:hypothetical protein
MPDVAINDGMEIVQLIADADLLDTPQQYTKFNKSIDRLLTSKTTIHESDE